ncbi:MAG: AbrB/MazE/SpoVT family DNA-binding domain-containing protein [Candidatus Levybacteria bacterium]|nr:AbrB/MazE/SpoVT family DNA-binding domain-containing protein [Candidatus Levybacteria bacterium]
MPVRKTEKRNIRSLTKIAGKSFGITFPIELIRKLGWRAKQKLTVTPKGKKLIVKDWKK